MPRGRKYPQELSIAVCVWRWSLGRPVSHVAAELGLPAETLRKRVRRPRPIRVFSPDLPERGAGADEGVQVRTLSCGARMRS